MTVYGGPVPAASPKCIHDTSHYQILANYRPKPLASRENPSTCIRILSLYAEDHNMIKSWQSFSIWYYLYQTSVKELCEKLSGGRGEGGDTLGNDIALLLFPNYTVFCDA